MAMLEWLNVGRDQNLHQHSAAQFGNLARTEQDDSATKCTLALFLERIVTDKVEVNDLFLIIDHSFLITTTAKTTPLPTCRAYRITALFQNADGGSRRQQIVLDKVKALLSSEHQTCLSNLLRKIDAGREHQSLGLNKLPYRKLVQSMSRSSLARSSLMFYKEHLKTHEGKSVNQATSALWRLTCGTGQVCSSRKKMLRVYKNAFWIQKTSL